MDHWSRRIIALGLGVLALGGPAGADMTKPAPVPPSTPAGSTAEDELNRGLRARAAKDYTSAEAAFRRALARRPTYAEAWNGLGYALRQQGKYPESLQAYHEALRLRPDFPEALEYLGEAYVKLGRLDDARRTLDRLKPLDAARARELAEAIDKGR
jgi:Flp pilus assembly protein TadD